MTLTVVQTCLSNLMSKIKTELKFVLLSPNSFVRRFLFEQKNKGHVRLYPETCTSNLKSVAVTVLALLAFNAQKFTWSRDPGQLLFEHFQGVMSGLCLEICLSNLMSLALNVLELLAFIPQNLGVT